MSKKDVQDKKNGTSLVIDLLNTFSKKEMNGLQHFASCQYFNTDKYVVRLIEVLCKEVLGKEIFDEAIKNMVYQKVFPDKVFVQGLNSKQKKRLNAKLTMLMRVVEHFLSIEAFEEEKPYQHDLLCQKILEKKQYLLFNRTIRKKEKTLATQIERDILYHKQHYNLSKNVLNHLHKTERLHKEDNLSEVLYHIDIQSCMEKLEYYMTMLSLANAMGKTYDTSSMEITLQLLDLPQYSSHPMLQVYKVVIQLMETQHEDIHQKLSVLLDSNANYIPRTKLIGFYGILINSCVQQIHKGKLGYTDLLDLYKNIDHKNLMFEGGFVPIIKLKNAITVGCRVGAFEWATEIIEKYKPFVNKPIRESVYHYNLGVIAFYQEDYKKALHHFIRVDNVTNDYDINGRVMLLKSFYETDKEYSEKTITKFRSAEKFFHQHKKTSPNKRRAYKNFVRVLVCLYKFRYRNITGTKMTLESIKIKLNDQTVNSDKRWLLEKIQELT